MNLYAVTIKNSRIEPIKTRTMFKFSTSGRRLKGHVKAKLAESNWELIRVRSVRPATGFEEYWERRKYKNY